MAAEPPAAPDDPRVKRIMAARELVARFGGAKLCFGDPVESGGVTVIPVASVRAFGGLGFGSGMTPEGITTSPAGSGEGGGGGGGVEAHPIGFVELGPGGARFEPIPDHEARARAVKLGMAALGGLVTTLARVRAARRRGEAVARAGRPRLLGR